MVGAVFDWVVLGMAGMFRFDLARSVDARLVKAGAVCKGWHGLLRFAFVG